ncbi:hypothetical protein [Jeongeupia chitinilytica]|uniref:DUF2214 domain-containing protein n=1 Tax=Jeongeupia chitinilytica TaxID=1041641 RepID=A0ABQ3H5S9_9NEIS|nr:hypothetical protein [Jeongeupia chitinilytica]GHD68973.1 hypothetical protein GCM10007350_34980 [Jeongeupia chitinilytica]
MKDTLRLLLLYPHLIACCVAIGATVLADMKIMGQRTGHGDRALLQLVSRVVLVALAVLWCTGLSIIVLDFGHWPGWAELVAKPKLISKLVVVSVLTLNGAALHHYALPRLLPTSVDRAKLCRTQRLRLACIGGVSAASWAFAAFLGIARPLANKLSTGGFLGLYLAALAVALGIGLISAPRLRALPF